MERKALESVELASEPGEVRAVVATFRVADADGDVTLPGAFTHGEEVRISAYGHRSWAGELPVGRGRIVTTENEAILEGRFFLNTEAGRETYETVKAMGDLQEWSYGFEVVEAERGEWEGEEVRLLRKLRVFEVSPVLVGAGVGTRTLTLKRAIPSHSTETTDEPWDAQAVVAALPEDREALSAVHAWVDPQGDPDAKASYKFPHHASPGAPANIRACLAGIASLNGARGGAEIPDSDRQGVWRHLARHLEDAGREPPELRSLSEGERKEGRVLSQASRARLSAALEALEQAASAIEQLLAETDVERDPAKGILAETLREALRREQALIRAYRR